MTSLATDWSESISTHTGRHIEDLVSAVATPSGVPRRFGPGCDPEVDIEVLPSPHRDFCCARVVGQPEEVPRVCPGPADPRD